jgi:hypothetical protein
MEDDSFTRRHPSDLRMCVYIEKLISGVTGLITMLLCYKEGKKILEGKLAEASRVIDPLYFHNWTTVFPLPVTSLFIPHFTSSELFATIYLVFAPFLSTFYP